jgi:hypothetical protein
MTAISEMSLTQIVLAIGSLGTAAYGFVDATKCFAGGVSNAGFGYIKSVVSQFIPDDQGKQGSALGLTSVLTTLRANWMNGMAMTDQKSVAKALIKLNLTAATAPGMAKAAGVDAALLTSVATKLATGDPLTQPETDVYGRFDLLLSAMLDQCYQRGDQLYRNMCKMLAIPVSVILALIGGWALKGSSIGEFLSSADALKAFFGGLLATPLAPVAKDLASAIQAGAKVAQAVKS